MVTSLVESPEVYGVEPVLGAIPPGLESVHFMDERYKNIGPVTRFMEWRQATWHNVGREGNPIVPFKGKKQQGLRCYTEFSGVGLEYRVRTVSTPPELDDELNIRSLRPITFSIIELGDNPILPPGYYGDVHVKPAPGQGPVFEFSKPMNVDTYDYVFGGLGRLMLHHEATIQGQ